jgi:hypothetical protein
MAKERPTRAWYLIPFFLIILGGIIGYFAVKGDDKKMANNLLLVGILMTIIWTVATFVFTTAFFAASAALS